MCVDSLSHCDRKGEQRRSLFSVVSAAAGGVGAVLCTADSVAGEEPSSGFTLCVWNSVKLMHPPSVLPRSSGLSPEFGETSGGHVHLRSLPHSPVPLSFLSGNNSLQGFLSFLLSATDLRPFHVIFSRVTVTLTPTMSSCPWSPPSWSRSFVQELICVPQAFSVPIKPSNTHYKPAEDTPLNTGGTCGVLLLKILKGPTKYWRPCGSVEIHQSHCGCC